jgi:hypothetical protein
MFAEEHAPYKVTDRILIECSEREGGLFNGKTVKKEYTVQIYKVRVRVRMKEPFVEYEYQAMEVKKDGTVSHKRFKGREAISDVHNHKEN